MKYAIILILTLLVSPANFACYNEFYSLDAKGQFHRIDIGVIRFEQNFDLERVERQLRKIGKKLQSKADYKLLSDYALFLVKGGKVQEALVIFEALAEAYPDEYSIAANLGTTYELSGNNEKALEYIQKGLKLNPDSHGGSEWIHVQLLRAKIALEKDPAYLYTHTILNLNKKQEESETVRKQLYTQLRERFPFCKGPDPVMADLFTDLGDCYLHSLSFEHAKGLYQVAKIYYQSSRYELDEKIENVRKLREKYANRYPDERLREQAEGMVEKISGVPYTSYLENPNASGYEINWEGILTDPDQLLRFAGLKPVEEVKYKTAAKTPEKTVEKPKHAVKESTSNNFVLWIGLLAILLTGSLFMYFKVKKR